jgi:hypothetical protein
MNAKRRERQSARLELMTPEQRTSYHKIRAKQQAEYKDRKTGNELIRGEFLEEIPENYKPEDLVFDREVFGSEAEDSKSADLFGDELDMRIDIASGIKRRKTKKHKISRKTKGKSRKHKKSKRTQKK